jgi:hypothetical protein
MSTKNNFKNKFFLLFSYIIYWKYIYISLDTTNYLEFVVLNKSSLFVCFLLFHEEPDP